MANRVSFETEIIPIVEADSIEPVSILVKVYKITIDETSENQTRELDKTVEYCPKRTKRKRKYQ